MSKIEYIKEKKLKLLNLITPVSEELRNKIESEFIKIVRIDNFLTDLIKKGNSTNKNESSYLSWQIKDIDNTYEKLKLLIESTNV